MIAKFLLDEQISPKVADRASGLDIRAVADSELACLDDRSIFRAAIAEGQILVTYNIADFTVLYSDVLKEGRPISGLVFVDADTIPTSDIQGLANALTKLASKITRGEVDPTAGVYLTRGS